MSESVYEKMVAMYQKQCGTNTILWLEYVMACKGEMAS